jgi:hypothetical protein
VSCRPSGTDPNPFSFGLYSVGGLMKDLSTLKTILKQKAMSNG